MMNTKRQKFVLLLFFPCGLIFFWKKDSMSVEDSDNPTIAN